MGYIIYGAGAIGGTVGAGLHRQGHDVTLIARGAHLEALQTTGMRLRTPDSDDVLTIPAVSAPREITFDADDVVILCMKTQDTAAALADLRAAGVEDLPIVCAQNGVENERVALRLFPRVYAMCVLLPATHLEPGVVHAEGTPVFGLLDVGRFPSGGDDVVDRLVADLNGSGFAARRDDAVMGRKYNKLVRNLGNAVDALCGRAVRFGALTERVTAEGEAVLDAAGIARADSDEQDKGFYTPGKIGGQARKGSSTWQSLAKGTGSTEIDYLNGEIVMLGRLHGVPTPVNSLLQQLVNELTRTGAPPESFDEADLLARLGSA